MVYSSIAKCQSLREVWPRFVNYVRIVCELCGTAVMVNRVTSEARYPVNKYYHKSTNVSRNANPEQMQSRRECLPQKDTQRNAN